MSNAQPHPSAWSLTLRAMFAPFFGDRPESEPYPPPAAEDGFARYHLHEHADKSRAVVERFISRRFEESFGSRVLTFMPRLFSLRDQNGRICGAFGLRSGQSRLFLEQYLDRPIETIVTARTGMRAERREIVEIGHFSGAFPGAVRTMIGLLTEQLYQEGYAWVAFTGTASLRNAFSRMGLPILDIQPARAECLPAEERAAWGSYYEHAPHVVIGQVGVGHAALCQEASVPALVRRRAA